MIQKAHLGFLLFDLDTTWRLISGKGKIRNDKSEFWFTIWIFWPKMIKVVVLNVFLPFICLDLLLTQFGVLKSGKVKYLLFWRLNIISEFLIIFYFPSLVVVSSWAFPDRNEPLEHNYCVIVIIPPVFTHLWVRCVRCFGFSRPTEERCVSQSVRPSADSSF